MTVEELIIKLNERNIYEIKDYEVVYFETVEDRPYSIIIEEVKISDMRKEIILK